METFYCGRESQRTEMVKQKTDCPLSFLCPGWPGIFFISYSLWLGGL
jgi:hypothetical protein